MENGESQNLGGSFLPPSGRNPSFPVDRNTENLKSELSAANGPGNAIEFGDFSRDISRMPDTPPKNTGHRRVRSEIVTLLDDITFGSDLGIVGGFDGPSEYSETEEDSFSMFMAKFNSSSETSGSQVGDSANAAQISNSSATPPPENHLPSSGDRSRLKYHQHSASMTEMLSSGPEESSSTDVNKSMTAVKLAELALVDPKRAKRIWANRQSAVRSKERKMRYITELEREVQTLQTQATSLSTQLTLLQRNTHGLVAENHELKLRLQAIEQQFHLQDVLNEALKKEIHHLRVVTGQNLTNGGPMMNFPPSFRPNHQFHPNNNQPIQTLLTAQQFHQLQIQSRNQFQQQQLHQFQRRQYLHQFQHHPSPPQPGHQLPENTDQKNSSSVST